MHIDVKSPEISPDAYVPFGQAKKKKKKLIMHNYDNFISIMQLG